MKNKVKVYLVALLISSCLMVIILSIQTMYYNSLLEENFKSMHERICISVLERAHKWYIQQSDEEITEVLDKLNGAPLTEDEKRAQLSCYVSNLSAGINSSDLSVSNSGGFLASDAHTYFDSDMNSILKENALLLVTRDSQSTVKNGSKAYIYYIYQDDSLTEQMQGLTDLLGNKINTVVFHVQDGYIRDNEFVPAKLSYYSVGEGGSLSKEKELWVAAKDREAMENEGYSFYEIDDSFLIGDIADNSDSDSYIIYAAGLESEKKNRIEELLKESQNMRGTSGDGRIFIRKKSSLATVEYFSQNKCEFDDGQVYYAVAYEKKNVFFDIFSYSMFGGHGLFYIGLIVIEILVSVALAIAGAAIYLKVKNK